jgi:hypothetical protein
MISTKAAAQDIGDFITRRHLKIKLSRRDLEKGKLVL